MSSLIRIRTTLLSAGFALAAVSGFAAGNNDANGVTVQNPTTVNIQQPASVNIATPTAPTTPAVTSSTAAAEAVHAATAPAVTLVNASTPAVTTTSAMTVQQRDEFVDAANITVANARQVAQKIDAGLNSGTMHATTRKELNNLNNRISDAEAANIRLQRSSVDTLPKDFKSAQKSLNELEDAYYPAAALFQESRQQEEQRVQAEITKLNQHKANLQATVGASKLSDRLKDDARDTERRLEAAIRSSQKRLAQLQGSKDHKWANLRHETQESLDRGDQSYHATIERLTRPS